MFVYSFNNVLRILFAKNELSSLVPLYTYLYLNKPISDKVPCGVNPELASWLISLVSSFSGHGEQRQTKLSM